jgi:hypothetical protein
VTVQSGLVRSSRDDLPTRLLGKYLVQFADRHRRPLWNSVEGFTFCGSRTHTTTDIGRLTSAALVTVR